MADLTATIETVRRVVDKVRRAKPPARPQSAHACKVWKRIGGELKCEVCGKPMPPGSPTALAAAGFSSPDQVRRAMERAGVTGPDDMEGFDLYGER